MAARRLAGIRLAANLGWLFPQAPFEQRFELAAEAGFDGVEYPDPYGLPAARLRALLGQAGLHQVLINTPQGPVGSATRHGLACRPDAVAECRAGIDQALAYAGELGADFVHVVAGAVPADVSWQQAFDQYVANIGWAAEQARGTAVRLLLEVQNPDDSPGFVLRRQADAAQAATLVDSERVALLFDLYHAAKMAATGVEDGMVAALESVRPLVAHVQIADPDGRHEPQPDHADWAGPLAVLTRTGYDGWIGCEYRPAADTTAGLDWPTRLAAS